MFLYLHFTKKMGAMLKKEFQKKVKKLIKKYFAGEFSQSLSSLETLSGLTRQQKGQLKKIISLFFLGQLLDLPTLNAILLAHGSKSNLFQIKLNKLCKSLTNSKLRDIFEHIFLHILEERLLSLSQKSACTWSRMEITAILDDSIFRQWLTKTAGFSAFYNSWFSGQLGRTAFGFKVLVFGVSIDGICYPAFLEFVGKQEGEKSPAISSAVKLTAKWKSFVDKLKQKGVKLPKIHLSCDNGYSDTKLLSACELNDLIYISVPTRRHKVVLEGVEMSIAHLIETVYLPLEAASEEENKVHTPFVLRVKVHYKCFERDVVLLLFRLQGSKKVSVIYTCDLKIMAKTLRRRWFNRTQIEQFFRLLKHTLKIQAAKTKDKDGMEFKLFYFCFVALHVQRFTRFVRKSFKPFKRFGFEQIRRVIIAELHHIDLIDNIIKTAFAKK